MAKGDALGETARVIQPELDHEVAQITQSRKASSASSSRRQAKTHTHSGLGVHREDSSAANALKMEHGGATPLSEQAAKLHASPGVFRSASAAPPRRSPLPEWKPDETGHARAFTRSPLYLQQHIATRVPSRSRSSMSTISTRHLGSSHDADSVPSPSTGTTTSKAELFDWHEPGRVYHMRRGLAAGTRTPPDMKYGPALYADKLTTVSRESYNAKHAEPRRPREWSLNSRRLPLETCVRSDAQFIPEYRSKFTNWFHPR